MLKELVIAKYKKKTRLGAETILYGIVLAPRRYPCISIKAIVYIFYIPRLFDLDTVYTIYKQKRSIKSIRDILNSGNYNKLLDKNKYMRFNLDLVQVNRFTI